MEKSLKSWSLADSMVVVLLCLLVLAFYRHIALGGNILAGVDAFSYFYPYRQYTAQVVRGGHVPLWNPYLFMGVPLLGNAQTAVFYPLNLLFCWLDGPRLVTWSIVTHIALAAISAYLYARLALRLRTLPALLGACAFACGGFLSGMVEHINQLNVSAWFPMLLLLWEWAQRETTVKKTITRETGIFRVKSMQPKLWFLLLSGILTGIGLLAGHTQSSYICLFGLGVYAALGAFSRNSLQEQYDSLKQRLGATAMRLWRILCELGLVVLVGTLLAAVQLVPTIELSGRSIRGGGLSYREAVAFSLKPLPRLLRYTFFPPLQKNLASVFGGDFFTEYVAYIGAIPLLLMVGWFSLGVIDKMLAWRRTGISPLRDINLGKAEIRLLILAGLGAFLAIGGYNPLYWMLYKLVPGFGLFRVPARWLFLYAFAAAMLAGVGLQRLWDRCVTVRSQSPPSVPPTGGDVLSRPAPAVEDVLSRPAPAVEDSLSRPVPAGMPPLSPPRREKRKRGARLRKVLPFAAALTVALTVVELFLASEAMPLAHPTAPEAFSLLRTAPAHILAAQQQEPMPGRFLSMSDILFDPGDQQEMAHMFAGQLDDAAIYDYVVSAKRKEILAPNLPLAWRIYAVDGYDGGVLPLQRYVDMQTLFLPPDELSPDGRLRENLDRIPPFRLLSLLGVRYVITDKVHDAWIDDVFYDLAFEAVLDQDTTPSITTVDLPALAANALGVVAYTSDADPGEIKAGDGLVAEVRLFASHQAKPIILPLTAEMVATSPTEHDAARLRWDRALELDRVEISFRGTGGTLHVQGLALIDERDGSSVPVLLSGDGRVRLVHSGDVKIYELPDALPRAYVVHEAVVIADDTAALAVLADPAFDPARQVIFHSVGSGVPTRLDTQPPPSQVTVIAYTPERVELEATLPAPGYLVLSDAYYPGWKATVDGRPVDLLRANVHFRAVILGEGTHHVELAYRPTSYTIGLAVSLMTSVVVFVGLTIVGRSRKKAAASHHPGEQARVCFSFGARCEIIGTTPNEEAGDEAHKVGNGSSIAGKSPKSD